MKAQLLVLLTLFVASLTANGQVNLTEANKAAQKYATDNNIKPSPYRNIMLQYKSGTDKNVIHIFVFQDGNILLTGIPTTALEQNLYKVHLFRSNDNTKQYRLDVAGTYAPTLNVDSKNSTTTEDAKKFSASPSVLADPIDFATSGPYTGAVTFTLKSGDNDSDISTTVLSFTVNVAKRIYASVGSGFVYSFISNPSNIHAAKNAAGDSTLLADSPKGNISLTIGATLYPWGRNSLMLTRNFLTFKDRAGILIATNIASSTGSANFKNVYLGLQYDFAVGGSFIFGLDVNTKRQRILNVDYSNFEFGSTPYKGKVGSKMYTDTAYGLFVGVQLDSRIFSKVFAAN